MRQKPNFGVGSALASESQLGLNSRLNLESHFEKDAHKDESPAGTPVRSGSSGRKAGAKPPSTLAVDAGKKAPRGDR